MEEVDTDTSGIIEVDDVKENVRGARDVIKIAKKYKGIEYAILAIENQEGIHYAMPVRVMGYDHYTYNKQYQDRKKYYKDQNVKLTGNEFISGIRKSDRFVPVVTLVLYYGEEEWDGPKCLHDLLDIPNDITEYINDYKINIIQVKNNNLKLNNKNNKDLFKVMSIVYDISKDRETRKQELALYEENSTIDDSVIDVVAAVTNINIDYDKAGERKMCTLWDEVRNDGREEGISLGRKEGISLGRKEGISLGRKEGMSLGREEEIFSSVQDGDYSASRGAQKLGITEDEFVKRMEAAGYNQP